MDPYRVILSPESALPTPAPVKGQTAVLALRAKVTALGQRNADLITTNKKLVRELKHRDAIEVRLMRSEGRCQVLLTASNRLQARLRGMSRRMLVAQEEDRKKISRDLHDVIVQTLTGITLLLEPLKTQAHHHASTLDRTISRTQNLVARSVAIVHRFARDLRPASLDDLGLIPALETFTRDLGKRASLKVTLTLCPGVEDLPLTSRTVLFRVAQEALTNAARHAKATHLNVDLQRVDDAYVLQIHDDGQSFIVEDPELGNGGNHLGLLSMHERMALAGGRLEVTSKRGQGTTISAWLPVGKTPRPGRSRGNA